MNYKVGLSESNSIYTISIGSYVSFKFDFELDDIKKEELEEFLKFVTNITSAENIKSVLEIDGIIITANKDGLIHFDMNPIFVDFNINDEFIDVLNKILSKKKRY
jgi:hypothetical protein